VNGRKAAAGFWSQVRAGADGLACLDGRHGCGRAVLIGRRCQALSGAAGQGRGGGVGRRRLRPAILSLPRCRSEVSAAGSIIVIRFKGPVDIRSTDCTRGAGLYRLARRDPDGSASAFAAASDHQHHDGRRTGVLDLFLRLTGQLPGLPPEWSANCRNGAGRRARLAPAARGRRRAEASPVRIAASVARPSSASYLKCRRCRRLVALNDQNSRCFSTAALTFRSGGREARGPSNIASINQKIDGETSTVEVS